MTGCSVHFNISLEDYEESRYMIFDMQAKRLRYKRKSDESDYEQGSDGDVYTNKYTNKYMYIYKFLRNLFTTEGCHFLTHTTFYQNTNLVSIKAGSTELALHSLVEQYYEAIDSDHFIFGIFLDFSRAFDTISHKIYKITILWYTWNCFVSL